MDVFCHGTKQCPFLTDFPFCPFLNDEIWETGTLVFAVSRRFIFVFVMAVKSISNVKHLWLKT